MPPGQRSNGLRFSNMEQHWANTGDAAKIVVQTASRMKKETHVEVDSSLAASPSAV
jgi:hypothetical protein